MTFGRTVSIFAVAALALASVAAGASELREKEYVFSDPYAVWKPGLAHVICDACAGRRRPPASLSGAVLRKLTTLKLPAPSEKSPAGTKRCVTARTPGIAATVHFDFDSDLLKESEVGLLRNFVGGLDRSHAASTLIRVTGYTDGAGGREYNDLLAFRRAFSVFRALKSLGVPAGNLALYGRGKCCYVSENPLDGANRRVEVIEEKKVFVSGDSCGR